MNTKPLWNRFAEKIRLNETTGCWEWTGKQDRYGYGKIKINAKWTLAHRVAYEMLAGPIPEGLCCLHRCDNPRCVNLDHLFLGTHLDNMKDCTLKGRRPSGERHYKAKLCESQVREIRKLVAGGMMLARVAEAFGVTSSNVRYICSGRTWAAA
jgi:hypothetical protein